MQKAGFLMMRFIYYFHKHRLWVLIDTALLTNIPTTPFKADIRKKKKKFLCENRHFTSLKFTVHVYYIDVCYITIVLITVKRPKSKLNVTVKMPSKDEVEVADHS